MRVPNFQIAPGTIFRSVVLGTAVAGAALAASVLVAQASPETIRWEVDAGRGFSADVVQFTLTAVTPMGRNVTSSPASPRRASKARHRPACAAASPANRSRNSARIKRGQADHGEVPSLTSEHAWLPDELATAISMTTGCRDPRFARPRRFAYRPLIRLRDSGVL